MPAAMLEVSYDAAARRRRKSLIASASGDRLEPVVVRHRPDRALVYDQDFCARCGSLGYYYILNPKRPEEILTLECAEASCTTTTRDGVPLPTPADADTVRIPVTNHLYRGIAHRHGGLIETSNDIDGTIDTKWPRRKKTL